MKFRFSKFFFGLLFLALGIGLLGTMLFGWEFNIFFPGWWTLFLIIPGLSTMLSNRRVDFWSVGLVLIGVALLLDNLKVFPNLSAWKFILAGALVYIGIGLLFSMFRRKKKIASNASTPHVYGSAFGGKRIEFEAFPTYSALFSSVEVTNACKSLQGGSISATFGSCEIDFSQAELAQDITIEVSAAFGGVEIIAPHRCRLVVKRSAVFGGIEVAGQPAVDPSLPCLTIEASATFGGIEIQ